jgi:hypothetical protein
MKNKYFQSVIGLLIFLFFFHCTKDIGNVPTPDYRDEWVGTYTVTFKYQYSHQNVCTINKVFTDKIKVYYKPGDPYLYFDQFYMGSCYTNKYTRREIFNANGDGSRQGYFDFFLRSDSIIYHDYYVPNGSRSIYQKQELIGTKD